MVCGGKSTTFLPPGSAIDSDGSAGDSPAMAVIYRHRAARPVSAEPRWWLVTPYLFVGLVTHERTRFPDASMPAGLMGSVAAAVAAAGVTVTTAVSDRDEYTDDLIPLSVGVVRDSIRAELSSELRWREYLTGRPAGASLKAFMALRRVYRAARLAPPWRRSVAPDDAGPRMVRRLANIELSHLRLIDEAVASGASWCLLLEDDAGCDDAQGFAAALMTFIRDAESRGMPLTVNMSESFTLDDLGIRHLLTPVPAEQAGPWPMLAAERPVTNTVCAVLYRGDFLARLHHELQRIPLAPVIPIDFKLNEALMRMAPSVAPGDFWVASPAPLTQRSGVPTVRL